MNLNDLAVEVAKVEGLKKQVSIGDIKEIIKAICRELYDEPELIARMVDNGKKQARK